MNMMKEEISYMKMKKNIISYLQKIAIISMIMVFAYICMGTSAPNTSRLDNVVKWILAWVARAGIVVAIFGGIQTALAMKNDDADAKVRGVKTVVSGFMVYGISQSPDLFGL
jgi:hypothetical protein